MPNLSPLFLAFTLLLLLLTLPALSQPHPPVREGLTYFPCNTSAQCTSPLICTNAASSSCNSPPCVCLPPSNTVRLCLNSTACPTGELCATAPALERPFCIDADHVEASPQLKELKLVESSTGLSFDICTSDDGCAKSYVCRNGDVQSPCPVGGRCRCFPPGGLRHCARGCKKGEVCARGPSVGRNRCVSMQAFKQEDDIELSRGPPVPTPTPPPPGTGLAFDRCYAELHCKPPRQCYQGAGELCTPEAVSCLCQYDGSLKACKGNADCDTAERCIMPENRTESYCVSEKVARQMPNVTVVTGETEETGEATPTKEPADVPEKAGCVEVALLKAFQSRHLVYERHMLREVLCDNEGSCATRGHVVTWRGQAMRMQSYCQLVRCVRRVAQVNSPRWRKGLRVKSRTDGLLFTAFAARYETRAEEVALSLLVRIGL